MCSALRASPQTNPVPTQFPDIAQLAHDRTGCFGNDVFRLVSSVGVSLTSFVENEIDFRETEAGQLDIKLKVNQPLQFNGQDLAVPARIERQLVVGEYIGPSFRLAEVRQGNGWHRLHAKKLGSFNSAMTCDDFAHRR